jgi:hypothetical protein
VTLEFNQTAIILSNDVKETHSDLLNYTIHGKGNQLTLDPTLMNEGDFITIIILICNYNDLKNVHGRIIGVPEVKQITVQLFPKKWFRQIGLIFIIGSLFMYFMMPTPFFTMFSIIYVTIGMLFFLFDHGFIAILNYSKINARAPNELKKILGSIFHG